MQDKELADAVVALGVATKLNFPDSYLVENPYYCGSMTAEKLVSDPRVAMALMEKCKYVRQWSQRGDDQHEIHALYKNRLNENEHGYGLSDSLPRAIIEACVEALS
jgi:hypothetical protein